MTVSREVEAEIQRLSHAEGWPPGTIAKELSVHHEVVERVLDGEHGAPKERPPRASALDPYKAFILQTLEKHPRLRAKRLYHMIRKRGFEGSSRTVRRYVARVRPKARVEAYLVCERLPGEQGQIDWGKVGTRAAVGAMIGMIVGLIGWIRSRRSAS